MSLRTLLGKRGCAAHTVPPDVPVSDAVRRMTEIGTRALVVVEAGAPAGILTESDILTCCVSAGERGLDAVRVADVMTSKPAVAEISDEVGVQLDRMLRSGIGCLPVVEDGKTVGVLFLQDLLQHRIEELNEELTMLHEYVASLQEAGLD